MIDPVVPSIHAHRGASRFAPENTLAAFQLAYEHGADAIEMDVKLSADGEIVIIHDQTVDRTTTGSGRVHEHTLAQLKEYDAGDWFSPQFAGERIPTLDEAFEALGKRLFFNIELTNYITPGDRLVEKVAACVRRHAMQESVLLSSFLPGNLRKAARLLPGVPVGIIALAGLPGALSRSFIGRWYAPGYVHPHFRDVRCDWVRREHARRRRVMVWDVLEVEDIRRMIDCQVDGLITDDPRLARQLLEERR